MPGDKRLDVSGRGHIFSVYMAVPEHIPKRILIVDDEPLACDAIRRVLEVDKHSIETATSAQEALAAFQTRKFDLLIIDYEMPVMKGDKLAAAIKAQEPKQPIIMVTAYGESLRAAGDFPLAVERVISKPFDLKDFREAVRQVVTLR